MTNPLPVVEVEDGLPLNYTIPDDTFQLNKPYGNLTLSGILQGGGSLPSWLSIETSGGTLTLSGAPSFGFDQSYLLNITATDSDGALNSTTLQLEVRAACPTGLFRHYRCIRADALIWMGQAMYQNVITGNFLMQGHHAANQRPQLLDHQQEPLLPCTVTHLLHQMELVGQWQRPCHLSFS